MEADLSYANCSAITKAPAAFEYGFGSVRFGFQFEHLNKNRI